MRSKTNDHNMPRGLSVGCKVFFFFSSIFLLTSDEQKISILQSDNDPHRGSFEGGYGQIKKTPSFKSNLLFCQLGAIQESLW